jgi:predicted secreted protein
MHWISIVAIFFLVWFIALFAVLPFSERTAEEAGEKPELGHADSAPHVFRPWPIVVRTSIVAAIITAAFYGVYRTGWISVDLPNSAVDRIQ